MSDMEDFFCELSICIRMTVQYLIHGDCEERDLWIIKEMKHQEDRLVSYWKGSLLPGHLTVRLSAPWFAGPDFHCSAWMESNFSPVQKKALLTVRRLHSEVANGQK